MKKNQFKSPGRFYDNGHWHIPNSWWYNPDMPAWWYASGRGDEEGEQVAELSLEDKDPSEYWAGIAYDRATSLHGGELVSTTLEKVIELVEILVKHSSASILDVASAAGEPGITIAKLCLNAKVTAIDLSETRVAEARRQVLCEINDGTVCNVSDENITCRVADAQTLPYEDNTQDVVICIYGLTSMIDHRKAIAEACRVLKPGGIYVCSVWGALEEHDGCKLMAKLLEALKLPPMQFRTNRLSDVEALVKDLQAAGFSKVTWEGFNNPQELPPGPGTIFVIKGGYLESYFAKLEVSDRPGIFEEAASALYQLMKDGGHLKEDGTMLLEHNKAYLLTGTK